MGLDGWLDGGLQICIIIFKEKETNGDISDEKKNFAWNKSYKKKQNKRASVVRKNEKTKVCVKLTGICIRSFLTHNSHVKKWFSVVIVFSGLFELKVVSGKFYSISNCKKCF